MLLKGLLKENILGGILLSISILISIVISRTINISINQCMMYNGAIIMIIGYLGCLLYINKIHIGKEMVICGFIVLALSTIL